jgi:hypothetical protein
VLGPEIYIILLSKLNCTCELIRHELAICYMKVCKYDRGKKMEKLKFPFCNYWNLKWYPTATVPTPLWTRCSAADLHPWLNQWHTFIFYFSRRMCSKNNNIYLLRDYNAFLKIITWNLSNNQILLSSKPSPLIQTDWNHTLLSFEGKAIS